MRTSTRITLLVLPIVAAAGLVGCTSQSDGPTSPSAKRSAEPSPTATATNAPTTPGRSATPGDDTAVAACASSSLSASIAPNPGGGAAGSTSVTLVLTNTGTVTCTLQGWPGVSFVGGGNGTQLGKAAAQDATSPHPTVTLATGGTAKSTLRIAQAANFDPAECSPAKADGFRVYPPGQKASLFAKAANVTACRSTSAALLTVSGLQ